jgi:hypothetical protein
MGVKALTLQKEHRLRVLDKGELRGVFEPGREEVTGGWKKKITKY